MSVRVGQYVVESRPRYPDSSDSTDAEALACRVGTVKSHTFRALARLRELPPGCDGLDTSPGADR